MVKTKYVLLYIVFTTIAQAKTFPQHRVKVMRYKEN